MIPKIIHMMWLDKKISNNEHGPSKFEPYIKSFILYNPDFKIMFWNSNKIKQLFDINPLITKYKGIWYNLPHHIQKCDVARYIIIYLFGGIYVDLDFMCFKNLTPLLDRDLFLVLEPVEHSEISKDPVLQRLNNGFIGSIKNHPFWLEWLDFICESLKKTSDVMLTTGPINFRIFFDQSKYKNVQLLDTCDIIPLYIKNNRNFITRNCIYRNHNSEFIDNEYYKHFGNYTHNRWFDGSGWGTLQLESKTENNINSELKRITEQFKPDTEVYMDSKSILLFFGTTIICILLLFYCSLYLLIIC